MKRYVLVVSVPSTRTATCGVTDVVIFAYEQTRSYLSYAGTILGASTIFCNSCHPELRQILNLIRGGVWYNALWPGSISETLVSELVTYMYSIQDQQLQFSVLAHDSEKIHITIT